MIGRVLFVATTAAALQAPFARVKNVQPAPPAGFQWADSAGAVVPTKAAKPAKEAVPALPAPVAQVSMVLCLRCGLRCGFWGLWRSVLAVCLMEVWPYADAMGPPLS